MYSSETKLSCIKTELKRCTMTEKSIIIIIIIIVQRVQYEQTTQCIENSAVHESYSETVQSAEIISLISDS